MFNSFKVDLIIGKDNFIQFTNNYALKIPFGQHIDFLKTVFLYSISAFGGPQGHLGMMMRIFVDKGKDVSKEELLEYNSFCQLLPGASSTQTLVLIGYKKGGISLAVITLMIWVMPAVSLMSLFSLFIGKLPLFVTHKLFRFIPAMAIGFLLYAFMNAYFFSIRNTITQMILLVSTIIFSVLFRSLWLFPILITIAGIVTNFSNKRFPKRVDVVQKTIKWRNLWLFVLLFVVSGFLSETARKNDWQYRKAFNLFENFYRFGSLVFGGSDVLVPMLVDQYVVHPAQPKFINSTQNRIVINKDDLLTGVGVVRAIPGPVFSIAAFTGGLALKGNGIRYQLLGCVIATVAIFLPSVLLVFFFFPVWLYLKQHVVFFRALEGINAVVTGFLLGSFLYLFHDYFVNNNWLSCVYFALVVASTFLLLKFSKIPTPLIVLIFMIFGFIG